MFFSPQRLPVSWTSICIALLGAVYCAMQVTAMPFSLPCPGNACHLFQDFTIRGVSLWWVGVGYFVFMALVCLRRAYDAALAFATLALIADTALLIIMLLTAVCVACLGAAAFIALLFFIIRRHAAIKSVREPGPSFALIVWSGFFIATVALTATEGMEPWRIAGPENAERRIYFAPSCPACRDAVTAFPGNTAFIPVAETESDIAAIYAMRKAIANGGSLAEALDTAMRAAANAPLPEPPFPDSVIFRLKLIRNKAEVLRLGFDKLPLILINGMPRSIRPARADDAGGGAPSYGGESRAPDSLPPELTAPVDSCGDASREPCDPPR